MLETFLRQAIDLSEQKMYSNEGGPFGAVIVRDGELLGIGWNKVTSKMDPTAHAEIEAIRDACIKINHFSLKGCHLYTSCEPCPMCLAAAYWARVEHIFFAAGQHDAEAAGFDDSNFYEQLAVSPDQRQIPMEQYLRKEACLVFNQWRAKADRTPY